MTIFHKCTWRHNSFNMLCFIFKSGTREAAFVHALSSAAVAVAVTRGCSRGELERCGCDRKVRGVSPEGEFGDRPSKTYLILSNNQFRKLTIWFNEEVNPHQSYFLSPLQVSSGLGAVTTCLMVWPSLKPLLMNQSGPKGCQRGDRS